MVEPEVPTNDPVGAGPQAESPALVLNVPAGQSVATVAPVVLTKRPAGAGVHADWPPVENAPMEQEPVNAVAPVPVT